MKKEVSNNGNSLPWWTWVAPFIIFYVSGSISEQLKVPTGSILFYLPIPIGIILVHWWGPRVLAGLLLYSLLDSSFWEVDRAPLNPIMITSDSICVFTSWYLFSYKNHGKAWLPNIINLLRFIALGIIIPITINSTLIYLSRYPNIKDINEHLTMVWTADFAASLALGLPALFFLTPGLERMGYSIQNGSEYVKPALGLRLIRQHLFEVGILFSCILLLSISLPLEKYWFIHGLFCVYIGVRFGFGLSLMANLAVFLITYAVPYFVLNITILSWALESDLLNIHFGMCLLSMTACITGRVISDLKSSERKSSLQFKELVQTHDELDRFVYSASHDLSAPLKSILGLVNVSRLEKDPTKYLDYVDKIEVSAKKLDTYIKEILDYSHNSRLEKTMELINVRDLINEVFQNLSDHNRPTEIELKIVDHEVPQITTDRMRVKMILNNLLSNAIKYQKHIEGHRPSVTIHAELKGAYILIRVIDNGQGIREEFMGKIFKMFYRGSVESNGSGLGLYIAKEAAEKMEGKITVESTYGQGSTFTLFLPKV